VVEHGAATNHISVTNPLNYGSEIPVDQSSIGSRDEAPQITLVQPRAPSLSHHIQFEFYLSDHYTVEASVAQDNGSNDDDLQIRPVQPPSLYFTLFLFHLSDLCAAEVHNGSRGEESQITPVHPPSLSLFLFLFPSI
jgi:hypothetical protein